MIKKVKKPLNQRKKHFVIGTTELKPITATNLILKPLKVELKDLFLSSKTIKKFPFPSPFFQGILLRPNEAILVGYF